MITHYAITWSKVHHPLTQEQYNKIHSEKNPEHEWEINGNILKLKNIADILTLEKYRESFPEKQGGGFQPYSELGLSWDEVKALPAAGFDQVVSRAAKRLSGLKRMEKGVITAIARVGGPAVSANQWLVKIRARIHQAEHPDEKPVPTTFPEKVDVPEVVAVAIAPEKSSVEQEMEIEVPF